MFLMAFFAIGAQAQTADKSFEVTDTWGSITQIKTTDTAYGTATIGKIWKVNKPYDYGYVMQMKAHSRTKVGDVTFTISGSIDGTNFISISTVTWKVSTADTTVVFNSSTTQVRWTYIKGSINGGTAGGKTTLGTQYLKIAQ